MLLILALAALTAQIPAPSPSPLKEIIRVKSTPLCSAIRQRIGPSVAALIQNDNSIADGTHFISEMDRDDGRPWMQIDKLHLEYDVSKIVRNLDAIYHLIEVDSSKAEAVESQDHAVIEALKNKLRAVADAQRSYLNVLDGTLETEQMAEMMNSDYLPPALATSGFDVGTLSGDEIHSVSAPFGNGSVNATPSPAAVNSIPMTGTSTTARQTQAGIVANRGGEASRSMSRPGDGYASIDMQVVAGIRLIQHNESEFAQQLLSLAAQCERLTAPEKVGTP